MDTAQNQKILTNGLFLGMAISSRFLVESQTGALAGIVSFILLIGIYLALIMWLKEYQKTLTDNKINRKQIISFTFKIFVIAALVSSIFKYIYFQHLKPNIFATIVSAYEEVYGETLKQANEKLIAAKLANNENDINVYQGVISQLPSWKAIFISPYFQAITSFILNVIGGTILGLFIWPIFKINQQRQSLNNQ